MANNAIKVFIKVRPLIAREKNENAISVWQTDGNSIKSKDKQYEMSFDHIYDETKTTLELFDDLAKPIVTSAIKGINGTIFAYGQTSSGKTYTMMGTENNPGVIPLTVSEIFKQIENTDGREFLIRIGYIEIYNERIFDLLDEKKQECTKLFEASSGEGCKPNQREIVATTEQQILENYESGNKLRRFGETNMNEHSSRSHTIFRITIESREAGKTSEEAAVQVSNLNLVDLAGSEKAYQAKTDGDRLKEGGHINKSLLALGNVIRVLSDESASAQTHINFRDSKLTRILSASLGGNAMTSIICTVTPAALDETYYTLVFAQNAKKIKNEPKVNKILTDQAIMKRMQREIQDLKNQLESRTSELQSQKLQQAISEREGQFLHSHNVTHLKNIEVNRRRTWCPSSSVTIEPVSAVHKEHVPVEPLFLRPVQRSIAPTSRDQNIDQDEVFTPGEETNLDRTLSPGPRNTETLSNLIHTPHEMKKRRSIEDSPNILKLESRESLKNRIKYLENQLQELNDFKQVETSTQDDHEKLSMKLKYANDHNAVLELKIEELIKIIAEKDSNDELKAARADRLKAIESKEKAEAILTSFEYQHEQFKIKSKRREEELLQSLHEAWSESQLDIYQDKIKTLEEKLKKSEELIFTMEIQEKQYFENQPDSLAGGDSEILARIAELELNLQISNEERKKLEQKLVKTQEETAKVMNDYDETSTQLIETIQENELLTKKLEQLESTKSVECSLSHIKIENEAFNATVGKGVDKFLNSIEHEELGSFPTIIEPIEMAKQLQINYYQKWEQTQNVLENLKIEIDELRTENDSLKLKLPTIQESFVESENELKDKCDSLMFERIDIIKKYESEVNKRQELEKQIFDTYSKEKMERSFGSQTSFNDKQDENVKKIEEQLKIFEDERMQTSNMVVELRSSLEERTTKVKELEDALNVRETEMATVIAELKDELQRIMSLGEENVRLKTIEKEHRKLVHDMTEKLEVMQSINEEMKACRGVIEVQKQRIHELEVNESNNKRKIENFEYQLNLKNEAITGFELEMKVLAEKNEELNKSLKELPMYKDLARNLDIQLMESSEELKKLQEQLQEISKQSESATSNTSEEFEAIAQKIIEEQQAETNNQLEELQSKISTLEKNLEESKASEKSHFEEIAKLNDEIKGQLLILNKQKQQLETYLEQRQTNDRNETENDQPLKELKISELQEELKEALAASELSAGELEIFKTKFEELQNQVATKEESIRILETFIKDKNQEVEELQKGLDVISKFRKEIENLKKQLSETENERDVLKVSLASLEQLTIALTSLKEEKLIIEADYETLGKKLQAETDEANERCKALQQNFVRIDVENTNLKSKLAITEENVKTLQKQLEERTEEYVEIKTRYRRRSCDNDKKLQNLELEKAELVKLIGANEAEKLILQQDLKKLKFEYQVFEQLVPKLQAEVQQLKTKSSENNVKYTILDEKNSQLGELNKKLETEVSKLQKQSKEKSESFENDSNRLNNDMRILKEQLDTQSSQVSSHLKTITQLREERQALTQQIEELRQYLSEKSKSPDSRRDKRASNELYVSRNQQNLLENVFTPTRAGERNAERKSRRQNIYDERRRLSVWERFTDIEIQTDPVSELCACSELAVKVKELQIEVRKKDCKVATMERLAQHNPLKLDVEELKKLLVREQRDHYQTKGSLDTMARTVSKLELKVETLNKNQKSDKEKKNCSCQTVGENFVNKAEYDNLYAKFSEMKCAYRQQFQKINEGGGEIGKENLSSNIVGKAHAMETENLMLKKKLEELEEKKNSEKTEEGNFLVQTTEMSKLKEEFQVLQKKYDLTRRLCNLRNDDIVKLKAEVSSQNEQFHIMQSNFMKLQDKYSMAKDVCNMRLEKLNVLRSRLGEPIPEDD